MRKINVIKPSYYDTFQCIGGDCHQNCCSFHWNIDITKQEFKQMKRALHSETLKEVFATAFVPQKGNSMQKTDVYRIKQKNGSCPFLDEQGLCGIYKDCGPEVMSKVCRLFPRISFIYYNEIMNRILSLGCEEVVRLLLQQKDGIAFISEEENISDAEIKETILIQSVKAIEAPLFDYFYDISSFIFAVLQNRNYEIGERMVLLGMAFQNMDKLEKDKKIKQIPQYMRSFLQNMDKPEYKEMYQEFFEKVKTNNRLRAMNSLITYHNVLKRKADNNIIERVNDRIDVQIRFAASEQQKENEDTVVIDQVKYHFDGEKYEEAEKQFQKWLEENSYILENIIVSIAWHKTTALIPSGDVWKNYCMLAHIYSIYRFELAMLITENTTQEQLIEDIVRISRSILHDDEYIKTLEKTLEENQSNTLAHMAVLVL